MVDHVEVALHPDAAEASGRDLPRTASIDTNATPNPAITLCLIVTSGHQKTVSQSRCQQENFAHRRAPLREAGVTFFRHLP